MKVCLLELIQKGGMVHYSSQLANALSNHDDMKVSIIIPEGTDCSLFNSNVVIKRIPVLGRHPVRIDLILKHILNINPDIVHIIIRHPFIIPLIPLLKIKKYPIILTIHDVNPHPGEKLSLISNITSKITMDSSKIIIVHGNDLKFELTIKQINEEKIRVIPHGDYAFFTRYEQDISENENTVLFFGRIIEYKGLENLIAAEPLISKVVPNLKIIIAGEGNFSNYEKLIKNKNNFEILNSYIPDDKVACLFQKSAVVVLPYNEASQSGIVPIAYSFKKPVVVTDVGCLKDVVLNSITGYVVPPRNVEKLSEAILELLTNSNLRKEMGSNAYNLMNDNLSWNLIAEKTIESYRESVIII